MFSILGGGGQGGGQTIHIRRCISDRAILAIEYVHLNMAIISAPVWKPKVIDFHRSIHLFSNFPCHGSFLPGSALIITYTFSHSYLSILSGNILSANAQWVKRWPF